MHARTGQNLYGPLTIVRRAINTHHTDAVMYMRRQHKYRIGIEHVDLDDSEIECEYTGNDGDKGNEQPVEDGATRAAHAVHDQATLRKTWVKVIAH